MQGQGQGRGQALDLQGQGQGLDMQGQGQGPSLQGQGLDLQGTFPHKGLSHKDKDKDFTYSYLLQVAAKPTIAIKQQQWTQNESSQDCKTHYTK